MHHYCVCTSLSRYLPFDPVSIALFSERYTIAAFPKLTVKKLSYRRGTARCVVSVEMLPIATQQCRNYSTTSHELAFGALVGLGGDPGRISRRSLAPENSLDPTLSRFSRTPTCDRQTQTDTDHSIYRACIASRGKNYYCLIIRRYTFVPISLLQTTDLV